MFAITKKNNPLRIFIKNKELFFLSLPAIVFIFIFSYIPMFGVVIAFKNFRYDLGFLKSPWVGFENFKFLFQSQDAWRITRNTIGLNAIFIITTLIVSVIIALMLNELSRRSVKVYQTSMFFPYFLSWVVVTYVFVALFDIDLGLVNNILKGFGIEPIYWYSEPSYWPYLLTFATVWKQAGYYSIIYYTGIMGIDSSYYDAAAIDGAGKWQQVRRVTLPLLSPLIIIMLLLQLGTIFYADFGLFYQVTRDSGVLYPTTDVIDTYVFRALRSVGDIGMASAVGLYQSFVGFILVIISNWVVRRIDREKSLF